MGYRMRRVTRREATYWLAPIRATLAEMRQGDIAAIDDVPVTRLYPGDDYARIEFCINAFRSFLSRICDLNCTSLAVIERKIAENTPITYQEIDDAFAFIKKCEDAITGMPFAAFQSAVTTESIAIEIEANA